MPVLDASVLVALLDAEDSQHAAARKAVRGKSPLRVPPVALSEATRAIRRRAIRKGLDGNAIAREGLALLRMLPGYEATGQFHDAEVARIYANSGSLSFADALCISAALDHGEELVTFDEAQLAAWRRERKSR